MDTDYYYDTLQHRFYCRNGNKWVAVPPEENSMSRNVTVTHVAKNVNSKRLFSLIKDTLGQVCDEYIIIRSSVSDYTYDFSQLAAFAELFMEDLVERKLVTQYDVICDERNNSDEDVHMGLVHMNIQFRQIHCVNVTDLTFEFAINR